MKHIKTYRILGVLIIFSLLLMVLPVMPVFAAHSVSLSPTSGNVGDTVTVYGTFDDSGSTRIIRYYFSPNNLTPPVVISTASTYELVQSFDNEPDPDILADNITVNFIVPAILNDGSIAQNVTSGTYYVYAAFLAADSLVVAKASFTVATATLDTPSPASGPAGTSVVVTGSNFPASTAITLKFDTTTILPVSGTTTYPNGTLLTSFNVPSTATVGAHTITVTAGTSIASATFTVTASPTINLLPVTGSAGTSVTVIGANFPASTALSFTFDTTTITISSGDVASSSGGLFTSTINIPTTATAGAHTITATAGTSTASATFTVTGVSATLSTLNPTSGPPGTGITISGTNFAASTALVFQFGTTTVTPSSGSTQTGSDGSFSSVIAVPSGTTAGAYTITVTAGTTSATATFTVTTSTTTPPTTTPTTTLPLSIDQEEGDFVGGTISVGASGFLPNSTVTVTIDGTEIAQKATDASGFVVISFKVPSIQYGEHTVIASDGTNIASANFSIESTAPAIPQPISPAMGEAIPSPAYFDWDPVTDISAPVTYKLQIATSNTFEAETIVLDLSGITTSEYTLTEAEQLKLSAEVTYYWREKSVDAAFNESGWTGAGEFTMIKPFEFTGWPLYLTLSLGGVILFLLGLWVGRRTAFYY
ncbi:MAG: hypothetical protein JXA17_03990 [Dehalococcoidales bacterium]|nr:hypothetical protein [Dehalococcoidales bacterium]